MRDTPGGTRIRPLLLVAGVLLAGVVVTVVVTGSGTEDAAAPAGIETATGEEAESVAVEAREGSEASSDSAISPGVPGSGVPAEGGTGRGEAGPTGESGAEADPPETGARPSGEGGEAPETEPGPGPTAGVQAEGPDVETLLTRAEAAYSGLRTLRADFRQVIEVPLLERRREGHGTWLRKGRGRFKMDFTEPPEDVIVADGEHLWLYYPSTNPRQVIRSTLEGPETHAGTADVLARILSEARTSYTATYEGREDVAGVSTHVVRLRPTGRSPYREVTVWIAADDRLVRRFRILEENETERTITLSDLRPDAPIADSVFRFIPPADADVFSG